MADQPLNFPDSDVNLPKTRYSGAYWMEEFRRKNLECKQLEASRDQLLEMNNRLQQAIAKSMEGSADPNAEMVRPRVSWTEALLVGIAASMFTPRGR